MKKRGFILFFLIIAIYSCKTQNRDVTKYIFKDRPIPLDILSQYLKKISLNSIDNGVDSFEIRQWYPFYFIDSFPVALERFYYSKGNFKGEYYLFFGKDDKNIKTINDISGLQAEKFEINDIPIRFLDSLITTYDLKKIGDFDINILKKHKGINFTTITTRNIFFEQASARNYKAVFIFNPLLFPGIDKNIDKYATYAKFTYDSLCLRDEGLKKWLDKRLERIYDLK